MAKTKKSDTSSGETKVFKEDMVDVIGTGKVEFMPKGKQFKAHKLAAEKLIRTGKATLASEKGESAE